MKKILLISLSLSILCCTSDQNKMIVSGNIDGLKKGTLYLQTNTDSTIVNLDSVNLKGESKFKLSTIINQPDIYYLYLDKVDNDTLNDIITFFGNKGEIDINTRLSTFDSSYEITGSKNTDLLREYFSIIRKYNLQNLDLLEIFYKAQIENNQNRIDSVNSQIENLIKRKYLYSLNFAITNSANEVSPYIAVSQIPDANKDLLIKLYDTLPINIKESKYGKILNNLTKD
ncbi:MAG: DUF4369 domain-containing protein [Flavobacteriaceae bacterium]|jgi:hypothetical protein|nr:hypothetical protein [Candidatus Neomarinimicrobiota bacterium]MDG2475519.1 DUF4369 domain-containing protein [Flavobacteriaceae bacterium]|tara:strand:+ start:2944 stop:3630 length:687 start_codon:yes stop_codon:yes gene_type:complete